MNKTSIEWTHRPETGMEAGGFTWNAIHAKNADHGKHGRTGNFCTRISPGCKRCYASRINELRGNGLEYTVANLEKARFYLDERELEKPLRRKAAATIFVGDMFDLFHESIPREMLDAVFSVIQRAYWHTFQILTKRADRMRAYFSDSSLAQRIEQLHPAFGTEREGWCSLPFDHVWLGVSVEDNLRALERIPRLQETPAAVRFLSVEPQLEHINLGHDTPEVGWISYLKGFDGCDPIIPGIDWVICGGESGPGARPFNLAWAKSLLKQCRAAGVPFFMKQIGSVPVANCQDSTLCLPCAQRDRKGGDPSEWPEHLRVREFPCPEICRGGSMTENRNEQIVRLRKQGVPVVKIAEKFDISKPRVYQITGPQPRSTAIVKAEPEAEAEKSEAEPIIHLVARNPQEMASAQTNLTVWFKGKLATIEAENRELAGAIEEAARNGWKSETLERQRARAVERHQFYLKCLQAVEQGYTIIPNIPVDVFAIRTLRTKPRPNEKRSDSLSSNSHPRVPDERPQIIPPGAGEYQNPVQRMSSDHFTYKDEKGVERHVRREWAVEYDAIEFPVIAAVPYVMSATQEAMAARVFDQIGVSPQRGSAPGDPLIIGQVLAHRTWWGYRKIASFLIAWHLDLRTL